MESGYAFNLVDESSSHYYGQYLDGRHRIRQDRSHGLLAGSLGPCFSAFMRANDGNDLCWKWLLTHLSYVLLTLGGNYDAKNSSGPFFFDFAPEALQTDS